MKKFLFLFLFPFLICNCTNRKQAYSVCSCEEADKVANFVSNNIYKANNFSDEEMEDVIAQLRYTAVSLYCHKRIFTVEMGNHNIIWNLPENQLKNCELIQY